MMSSSWHTYPSIYSLGHQAIAELLRGEVMVEEKVDGSQFSFGMFVPEPFGQIDPDSSTVELRIRSKGAVMHIDAPEKMFTKAVETVKSLHHLLHLGWTYRGEYLAKPKHNALAYDRVPNKHVILFDVNTGEESYLSHEEKFVEADRLGLECVPLLYQGIIENIEDFRQFLQHESILGGQKIEGVVIKPVGYNYWGRDKKCLMGKFVSEAYKEVHSQAWKSENPVGKDILALLGDKYGTPARWNKAIQHLREAGQIEDSPRDIGLLMREIPADIEKECQEEIKDYLYKWAWDHIRRLTTRGFPQYYKEQLLKLQFERGEESNGDVSPLS